MRAVSILEQFTVARPELNLTEISTGGGLSKSTAHRLLATLETAEMVEFDEEHRALSSRSQDFRLGSVVSKSMELVKQADPLLRNVTEETGETSFLQAADGNEALCLRRFDGAHHVRVLFLEAGKRSAFNCGAGQRVLLAHLPEERWEESRGRSHPPHDPVFLAQPGRPGARPARDTGTGLLAELGGSHPSRLRLGGAGAGRHRRGSSCGKSRRDRSAVPGQPAAYLDP